MKRVWMWAAAAALLAVWAGCSNPLIGLGEKVDLDTPKVSIGEYGDGTAIRNGDYVRGEVVLNGEASDDIGIKSVKVSVDGGASFSSAAVASGGKTWSYTLDTTAFADGEKDIIVLVTDTAPTPRTSEDRLLLYFDNTPPVVVVNSPAGYASTQYSDATLSLKGEAVDPYRIRSVEVNQIGGGSGTLTAVEGTSSWSCEFESAGTGTYLFEVVAEDYAGNRSSHFYHYDDILPLNDNVYITPEKVYKVENGEDVDNLTGTELAGAEMTSLPLQINLDDDIPNITISNPDPNAQVFDNVLSSNPKFIGSVTDDDGVAPASLEISFDGGDWQPVSSTSGSGNFITWEDTSQNYAVSGDHSLQLRVEDIYGVQALSQVVNYRINTDAASVDITSPAMSAYLDSASFTVEGTAQDANGITNIDVSLDNGSSWQPAASTSESLPYDGSDEVSWTYEAAGLADGLVALKVRASDDNGGTWAYSNLQFTVDTQAPTLQFKSPAFERDVNGNLEISGISTDNSLLQSTALYIGGDPADPGDPGVWQTVDSYNWSVAIDTYDADLLSKAVETSPGSGVYRLDVYARAVDMAGNTTETAYGDYYFYINNFLDIPEVSIISPQAGASLGGSVIVSGSSSDDDGAVEAVYMQIDVTTPAGGTPDFSDTVDLGDPGIDFDGLGGDDPVTVIDESQAYLVSGKNPWSVELNTYGELYNSGTPGGPTGEVHVRVFAIDQNGISGQTERAAQLHFTLDDSIPTITGLDPASDSYQNGVFYLTGLVSDETQIRHLEISYDGGASWEYIIRYGEEQPDYHTDPGSVVDSYSLDVEIDTADIPGIGAVSSDDITIRLRVTDDTNYQSQASLTYYIDNLLPTGYMTQNTSDVYGSYEDADHNAVLYGMADDTGTVSGVKQVVVYFVKDGSFYDPRDGTTAEVTTADINGSIVNFPTGAAAGFQLIIDDTAETLSGANSDEDGLAEELNVGEEYEWKLGIDSNNLADGINTMHYVVYDRAGNRYHNTKAVFVKNDKPVINGMQVGYDLDGSNNVQGDEIFPYSGEFKARNRLYFEFDATDGGGIATYEVFAGSNDTGALLLSGGAGGLDANELDISGAADGPQSYFCKVTDGDGISDSVIVEVDIDNTDDVPPVFMLDALTQGSVVDGHLEAAGDSLYDGSDPDVSGTVQFTGTASDDQGMQAIRVTIDGVQTVLAAWDSGSFVSQDGNFSIDSQIISPISGHSISWTYTWDSSTVSDIAENNVSVDFVVDDFGAGPNQDSGSMTLDVVPYISDITTGLENGTLQFIKRSALGRYPVQYDAGETIRISGYNLYPDPDTVTYPSDLVTVGSSSLTITGRDAAGYSYVDVAKDSLTSGELTVTTHGIPSINNTNDNGLAANSEAESYKPLVSDDRYLYFWQLESHGSWSGKTEAVMRPHYSVSGTSETTDMDWYYLENGQRVVLNDTELTNSWSTLGGDFYINDDGTPIWIFLHNMNWRSGADGYPFYGSVQWGKDEATEAAAYNWHRSNRDRLGIGNLSFVSDANYAYNTVVMERYKNLQIVTHGGDADTDNFVAYYDVSPESQGIAFYSFKTGTGLAAGDQVTAMANGWSSNLSKYSPSNNTDYPGSDYNVGLISPYNDGSGYSGTGRPTRIELTSGGADSEHFDIVLDDFSGSPRLYMAYYDGSSSELKFMYNTDPVNDPANWQARGTGIDSGAGLYVDMAVDPDQGIHIAYYDASDSNLKYAYLPSYDCSDAQIEVYTVDALFTNGMYTAITVKDFDESTGTDYRPVISHYSLSFSGTNYALRAAWPVHPLGDLNFTDGADNFSGDYTGAWEVTPVTAATPPSAVDSFIAIDSVRDTSDPQDGIERRTEGELIIGYNGGYLEEARLLSE